MDMGVEPYLLKQSLRGAVAQRLVRKLCEKCKEKIKIKNHILSDEDEIVVYKASGCEKCNYSGYKGRIMISEVVDFSETGFENLSESKNSELIKSAEEFMKCGEISIDDYLLFREEEIDIEV